MRRTLTALATSLTVLALLSGCADDRAGGGGATTPGPSTAGPEASAGAEPSATESPTGPTVPDMCEALSAEAVAEVLGAPVERAALAETGCRFASPTDPDAASVGLVQGSAKQLGGLEGARAGIRAVVDGRPRRVDLGDGGFVVAGQSFGGSTLTGGGAVRLGDAIVQVTLLPGDGATEAEARRLTTEVLGLVVGTARP